MTFPKRMRYGGGCQERAVPLRLAHYPPVITCFRHFLGAHRSERTTAAREVSHHTYAAWRRMQEPRRVRERTSGRRRLRPLERHATRRLAALLEKALGIAPNALKYPEAASFQYLVLGDRLRRPRGARIRPAASQRGGGGIVEYQVTLKVGFRLLHRDEL